MDVARGRSTEISLGAADLRVCGTAGRVTFVLSPPRMSVQILLQGRILGTEAFLLSGSGDELDFAGRAQWLSLLSEVLPRAILAELRLAKILLGSSGGEQFLIVLPQESRGRADDFFTAAR